MTIAFQQALDVKTTSNQRLCDVMTSHRRCFDVMCLLGFISANDVGPDVMTTSAAFRLCLHCLLKYLFWGMQYTKG